MTIQRPERTEVILQLHRAGVRPRRIAELFDMSRQRVSYVVAYHAEKEATVLARPHLSWVQDIQALARNAPVLDAIAACPYEETVR